MERTILHEIVHGLGGKVLEILQGQLISKCPFGVKTSSKKPTKFPGFLLSLLKEIKSKN